MIGDNITEDPRASLLSAMVLSAFQDNLENQKSRIQQDHKRLEEQTFKEDMKVSSRSSSLQKLGWPLLRSQLHTEISTDMSVVQWVMNLPDRSSSQIEDKTSKKVNSFNRCKRFNFEILNSCTCRFSEENVIGIGGSNRVYRGTLPDGKQVAVKVMQSSKQAFKDFFLQVEILSALNHTAIAPLLGICIKDGSLISVYDYFPQGTLDQNLRDIGKNNDGSILSWEVRFKVAVGIAEALNYLHNQISKPVIHRDVKSSNILLSRGFEPKLCDFGLAMWGPTTASFAIQNDVVGTFGYLAPEYFMYGKVSDKIDVYAFGVVLLELISGREPIHSKTCKGRQSLVLWAKPILESGDVKRLMDTKLQGKFDVEQMNRMVLAASLCITRAARLRPTMNQILKTLKGYDEKDENLFKSQESDRDHSENQEKVDDEVYPNSTAELHLSLSLLDIENDTASHSSIENDNN